LCLWPFCWYNPFFLAARRRLRINCELACDAEVLKQFPERTAEYGRLLLSFANTSRPPEVAMAFREYAGELRSRIIYMTQLPTRRKSSLGAVLFLAFLLAAPFGLFSAVNHHGEEPERFLKAQLLAPAAAEKNIPAQWLLSAGADGGEELLLTVSGGKEKYRLPVRVPFSRLRLRKAEEGLLLELYSGSGAPVSFQLSKNAEEICKPVPRISLSTRNSKAVKLFTAGQKEYFVSL
jgi:hypothetical protein